jgi:hypothetical protein
MKKTAILACAAALSFGAAASADVVAYWAFNNDPLPGGGFGYLEGQLPIAADYGQQAGVATVNVFGGITDETIVTGGGDTVYRWIQDFTGTALNAQFGEQPGGSLSLLSGTGNANNGAYIEIAFDASLKEDLVFSFDARRTGTGFNDVTVALFDGMTFLENVATGLNFNSSGFDITRSFDISSLDGVADARIRIIVDFVFMGTNQSATGNNRYDNFLIEGTKIPTPGSAALLALGGLVAARRRRA